MRRQSTQRGPDARVWSILLYRTLPCVAEGAVRLVPASSEDCFPLDGIMHTLCSILLRISPPYASECLGHLQRTSSVGSTGYPLSLSSHHLPVPERHGHAYFSSSSALGRRGPRLLQLSPAESGAGHGGGGGIVGGASRLLPGGGALPLAGGGRRHHGGLPPPGRAGGPGVLRDFQWVFASPFATGRRTPVLADRGWPPTSAWTSRTTVGPGKGGAL